MDYFFVSQNKTFKKEFEGGYIWAPKKTRHGKKRWHWESMKDVAVDDIIFSLYHGAIVSVNVAKTPAYTENKPESLDQNGDWENDGLCVKLEYRKLTKEISVKEIRELIEEHRTNKYYTFTKDGITGQVYLSKITEAFGNDLMSIIREENNGISF